jgi:hypothetical protein
MLLRGMPDVAEAPPLGASGTPGDSSAASADGGSGGSDKTEASPDAAAFPVVRCAAAHRSPRPAHAYSAPVPPQVLIDFGLARPSPRSAEDRAVDLYVLERAIVSMHCEYGDTLVRPRSRRAVALSLQRCALFQPFLHPSLLYHPYTRVV